MIDNGHFVDFGPRTADLLGPAWTILCVGTMGSSKMNAPEPCWGILGLALSAVCRRTFIFALGSEAATP